MKLRNLRLLTLLILTGILLNACKKVEIPNSLGDRGQTIIKFMTTPNATGYNYNLLAIDLSTTSQVVNVIDIRRDAPNEAELNKTLTATVREDAAALVAYNNANGTSLVPLPSSVYTIDPSNPRVGTDYTFTFNPGEFSKQLKIVIPNSSTLDLTKRYGIGLTLIAAVTGADGRVSFNSRTVVVEISLKNKYDGVYEINGYVIRGGDPVLTGPVGPVERNFETSGPNSVQWVGSIPWSSANGGNSALPDGYQPNITLDPITNIITSLVSPNGLITMNPAYTHTYNPATRTFTFEFTYAAGAERRFTWTAKWLRAR